MAKGQKKVGQNRPPIVAELPAACADEGAALAFMEKQRWGGEPFCPRCGVVGDCYPMTDRKSGARSERGTWRCRACNSQFSVRTGTIMEGSYVPLRAWCFAFWAASASKKGVSAKQVERQTGVSYKTALFLMHRIRHAMGLAPSAAEKLTGVVEADETWVGGKPRNKGKGRRKYWSKKVPVVAVVQRGGSVRVRHMKRLSAKEITAFLKENVDLGAATLHTDESKPYTVVGREFAGGHETVFHAGGEYARGDVTTNSIEGFFGLIKRALYGTWHSVSEKHLNRYVDECAFRFNTRDRDDGARVLAVLRAAEGKHLSYKLHVGRS